MGQTQRSKQSKQLGIHLVKLLRAFRRLHIHSRGSETKWKRGETQLSTLQCSFRVSVTPLFVRSKLLLAQPPLDSLLLFHASIDFTALQEKLNFYEDFAGLKVRGQLQHGVAKKKKESRDSSNGSSSRGA